MKIYIDTSALNRIFDDRTQVRIALEANAMQSIFLLIEHQKVELVSSDALAYEVSRIPSPTNRLIIEKILNFASHYQSLNPVILERARYLEQNNNLGQLDAFHVACAEAQKVGSLITCDDRLIKRYKGELILCNPAQFVLNITTLGDENED